MTTTVDIPEVDGAQIMITAVLVPLLGDTRAMLLGEPLVNGRHAAALESDSRGYTLTRPLPYRFGRYSVDGARELVELVTLDLLDTIEDSELAR